MSAVPPSGPPKSRLPLIIGGLVAGGAGYYFYNAGGNARVAKKSAEHDAARLSSGIRSELPGLGKETQKSTEEHMARIGSSVDKGLDEGKRAFDESTAKAKAMANSAVGKIHEVDAKVENEAGKVKGGVMGWFGK